MLDHFRVGSPRFYSEFWFFSSKLDLSKRNHVITRAPSIILKYYIHNIYIFKFVKLNCLNRRFVNFSSKCIHTTFDVEIRRAPESHKQHLIRPIHLQEATRPRDPFMCPGNAQFELTTRPIYIYGVYQEHARGETSFVTSWVILKKTQGALKECFVLITALQPYHLLYSISRPHTADYHFGVVL